VVRPASSSSHALIGGLIGSALVSSDRVKWEGVVSHVLVSMVISPLIGLVPGYLFMLAVLWVFRRANVHRAPTLLSTPGFVR